LGSWISNAYNDADMVQAFGEETYEAREKVAKGSRELLGWNVLGHIIGPLSAEIMR
jgi:hypothetical protein